MTEAQIEELNKLPLKEKIKLVQQLWENIAKEQSYDKLPEDHKETLNQRLSKLKSDDTSFRSWKEIKSKYSKE
jgi:putative addiction module component (TIGR02574 family)